MPPRPWLARRLLAGLLAAALPAGPARAQEARTVGLAEAMDRALTHGLVPLGADLDLRSAEIAHTLARRAFLPDLSLQAGVLAGLSPAWEDDAAPPTLAGSASGSLGLDATLPLYRGGALRADLLGARLDRDAAAQVRERAREEALWNVFSGFLALGESREQARIRRSAEEAAAALEARIAALVEQGTRHIADLYLQRASVAEARAATVDADQAVTEAELALVGLLQFDPLGAYAFVVPEQDPGGPPEGDPAALVARAWAARPDLRAAARRVESREAALRGTRSLGLPRLDLQAGAQTAWRSDDEGSFGHHVVDGSAVQVGLEFSMPLLDRWAGRGATEQARIDVERERLALQEARHAVGLAIRSAVSSLAAARARLEAAEARSQAAAAAHDVQKERYLAGVATLVELSDARNQQVSAEAEAVRARYTLRLRIAALRTLLAEDLRPGG